MQVDKRTHVLVISLSNIGDVVLTTPVIMNIAKEYNNAHISVVVGPKAESLLEGSCHIQRLIIYNKKASLFEKLKFIFSLWRYRYDIVVDLRNTAIPFLVPAAKRSRLFRAYQKGGMRKRHLHVLAEMGVEVSESVAPFDFFDGNDKKNAADKLLGQDMQGILIAAGSASEQKRWPLARYREVIQFILKQTDSPVFLIGDEAERSYVEELCQADVSRIFNLAGRMSLRETSALISECQLLVTNDSAAMHLGHEMCRHVIALFGPSDPEKYGREGKIFRIICGSGNAANQDYFEGVTVQKVIKACEELLTAARVES